MPLLLNASIVGFDYVACNSYHLLRLTFFPFRSLVSHHVMGMGFTLITQPDVLGDLPPNVLNCNNQELDDSTHNDGDTDHSGDTNSTTNGNSTNGGKQSSGSPSMHGRWNIALASLISVILFSVSA